MPDAEKISRLLLKKHPDPKLELDFTNPLELLVATILAARATDEKINQVTPHLFARYETAADYASADRETFEQEIRSTGFYRNKAKAVMGMAQALVDDFGGEVPASVEEMVKLPGVGRKTANVVLGNAFGQPAIGVDAHVGRVANRLGLTDEKNPDKVEAALKEQLPEKLWTATANALTLHGRYTCTAKKPACGECVLYDECEWEEKPARERS
ncbi:MAG: endonuclease III [Thermoanaerobaculia bacterium]|nr:endonuclease III [Thermoanaerobaculia bacterium]